jgi:phosphoglucosamine mutase
MNKRLFGTDGIRGRANKYPITAEVAMKFAMAVGSIFKVDSHRHRVIIAKDTRLSGYLIEPSLTAGFISVGIDVILVGPMPTPAVPMLMRSLRADLGVMISASHNPHHDNGLKLFGSNGLKLSDAIENQVEEMMLSPNLQDHLVEPADLGRAKRLEDAQGRYLEYVKTAFPKDITLGGLRIVLDCANGGGYKIAPSILWELGAEVITIGCEPNGFNINQDCGSTHPQLLANKVVETRADIGIALDGDGDRIVVCDEKGTVISGDHVLGAISKLLKDSGQLRGEGVVLTHMANSGLENYLADLDLKCWRTQVGDRYVFEEMQRHHCNLGGEPSGHIIYSKYSSTGDGIVAALQILTYMLLNNCKASQLHQLFKLHPQYHLNIPYKNNNPLEEEDVNQRIDQLRKQHHDTVILVRKSGTERLIRVMVEATDGVRAKNLLNEVSAAIDYKS